MSAVRFILHALLVASGVALAQERPPTDPLAEPLRYEKRAVTIWSDGTRMIGDLYLPKDLAPDEKRPAIVFGAGTGGTRRGTPERLGPIFAHNGFVFLGFDYRGWGDSDARLQMLEPMPKPDEKGEVTVHARAIRWQMDYADQTADLRAAVSFLSGEPHVDAERLGLLGSSYGGGLVTWVAEHDPRVRALATQVGSMAVRREPAVKAAYGLATRQARGEVEPVPFETGKLGGKMARYDKMRVNPAKWLGFNPLDAADSLRVPTLIIDAEKEELMNLAENGARLHEELERNGVPVAYHVLPGISHYGVYGEGFEQATTLELQWFAKHLGDARTSAVFPPAARRQR